MFVKTAGSQEWVSAGYEGAERAVLRLSQENGRTAVVRIKAGATGPRHRHAAGEDVLVISGQVVIDGATLNAGDYCYTEAGETHELKAIEDSVIYVSSQKPVTVLSE
ncbi:MAG: cupin domain-containing protein [Betaproteobacteria bacterium]